MLKAPRLKLDRGISHYREFVRLASNFLAMKPYDIQLVEDETHLHLVGMVNALIPDELGLILGDALHNLRASLDILINEVISIETGRVQRDASFPIFDSEENFEIYHKRQLPGATKNIINAVKSVQPFVTNNNWLRQLHDLDIYDKHKSTSPVVGSPSFHNIQDTAGTLTIGTVSLDPSKIGVQPFVSVMRNMNIEFYNRVDFSYYFFINKSHLDNNISVDSAFESMRAEVIKTIENLELCIGATNT